MDRHRNVVFTASHLESEMFLGFFFVCFFGEGCAEMLHHAAVGGSEGECERVFCAHGCRRRCSSSRISIHAFLGVKQTKTLKALPSRALVPTAHTLEENRPFKPSSVAASP